MNESIILGLYVVALLAAIFFGMQMDKKFQGKFPQNQTYAFGYTLGIFVVLLLPIAIIRHVVGLGGNIAATLPFDIGLMIVGLGIIYRRMLAWIVLILANVVVIVNAFSPMVVFTGHGPIFHDPSGGAFMIELIISLLILAIITMYFFKRRQEMTFL